MMYKYKRLVPYIIRQWPIILASVGLIIGFSLMTAIQPWPIKILIDNALGGIPLPSWGSELLENFSLSPTPIGLIIIAALCTFGIFVLNSLLGASLDLIWSKASQNMVWDLSVDMFYRLLRQSAFFHINNNQTVGDKLTRLTADTYCLDTLTGLLMSPVQSLFTLITIGLVAWNLNSSLTIIVFIAAPFMAVSSYFFGRQLNKRARQAREVQSKLTSFVHQVFSVIPLVQSFGSEERNNEHFQRLADDAIHLSTRGVFINNLLSFVNGLIMSLGIALVLYLGSLRVLSGALSLGSLVVFLSYLVTMKASMQSLFGIYGKLKTVDANIDRVIQVLDSEHGVRDEAQAKPLQPRGQESFGHLMFKNVTFGYEEGRPVLNNVSLEAYPGEVVALVGSTGAGKSTLVSLIPRFFDPWEGQVLFDGIDVRKVTLASLRSHIAIVLQEPFLLPLTVAENIAYGRPGASREEIVSCAVAANADEFIRRLPEGYDTVIGERGATLSGGEKQRLSIARALLKDAQVLILDEPTSSLDAQTEALLLEALERLMDKRTTFIIAHRLSTIRRADKIAVIEAGKIVEIGNHEELLASGGIYNRLHRLQVGLPGAV